jgi:uncharacterized membrane protein
MTTATPLTYPKNSTVPPAKTRIASIDLLRGLVMLIMAIDHLRDMLHLGHPNPTDLQTTTPALFFTRWVTHFCAPTFIFLSGLSAFLAGKRRSTNEMAGFLLKRGLWLILVDLVIINFAASADPFYHVIILQVIWAIGGSMILLGLLVGTKASPRIIGGIGLLIFFGHNVIDLLHNKTIDNDLVWRMLLSSTGFTRVDPIGPGHVLLVAYSLLPWTGIMLVGYSLGVLYTKEAGQRKRILATIGLSLLALFVLFRGFSIYGDPAPWSVQKNVPGTIMSFLNVTKYPPSLLYCCMTLGVALLILAYTEKTAGRLARILIVYGNVPFFYYVLHWFLAQAITITLFFSTGHHINDVNPDKTAFLFSPNNFGLSLGGLYVVWLLLISVLYLPCRWFGQYKRTHRQWWLSYL